MSWGTDKGWPDPPWALLDFYPDEGVPLQEWLEAWRAKGVEPMGGPGVFNLNGRVVHRYRMEGLRTPYAQGPE